MANPLLEFAVSERQREAILALEKAGSWRKAAKLMGIGESSYGNLMRRVRRHAAARGYSPEHDMTRTTSPVHVAKGTSTLYDAESKPILQWVKTSLQLDQMLEIMRETADELKSDLKPQKPVKLNNRTQLDELLNLYILTDVHVGMNAWAQETGSNWNLEIAERTILEAIGHQIAGSPDSRTGYLMQLGDALHYDGMLPITPQSGHVLDVDGRFPKVVRTVIRVFRQAVNMLLAKHEKVIVLHAQGNHDLASSVWLQEWFSILYEDEPRVEIIVNPNPYYAYVHGEVMIGAHHGHKRSKLQDLVRIFHDQFRHLHGTTKRTYIHTGHYHTDDLYCSGSTRVERHETLAARDSHSSSGGWLSGRSMKCITYNRKAETQRLVYYPQEVA